MTGQEHHAKGQRAQGHVGDVGHEADLALLRAVDDALHSGQDEG